MYVCSCRRLTEDQVRSIVSLCPYAQGDSERFFEEFDYVAGRPICSSCHAHILEILEEVNKTARE
jgi:bacterioferritin-associated ferredoxin